MSVKKFTCLLLFVLSSCLITFKSSANVDSEIKKNDIVIGKKNSKVEIIIYSSFTCPHCAKFHNDVLPKLKKEFVDNGNVRIILRDFPLDLASLNASKMVHCLENKFKFKLLDDIYEKQNIWTKGEDIETINKNLKKVLDELQIQNIDFDKCLNDETSEQKILQGRINAQKKYKINSTPTIIINEKKYDGPNDFMSIAKKIKQLI